MSKKYLVTGANGYIGRYVVKNLLDMGNTVIASDLNYDSLDERAIRSDVDLFSGDADIYKQYGEPDVCIHLAWRNGFVHNHDSHITDIPGHYLFIKNMIEGGLKHIVVMGSMHEIGYWEGAIEEDTPANPKSNYGIAKNTLRQLTTLLASQHEICMQWLRGYYILGDDLKNSSVFTKITQLEQEGAATFPFNSGKNKYDFITVEQLAKQIASVASQEEVTGVINCCSGNPVSLADKVEEFIEEHHFKIRPEYGAFPDRVYDSPGVWGNPDKINQIMRKQS